MRRLLVLLGFVLMLVPAFGGCGVTEEGGLQPDGGGGTSGDGGIGVGGGQCFPGSKVCPDPKKPTDLLCLTAEEPGYGCSKSTSCAPCVVPHATAKCSDGACAVDTCDPGWADCSKNDPTDGCEADLSGDKNHCGDCATDCVATKGPGWICTAGQCEVNECCPTGLPECLTKDDCDKNKANGCEVDKATDAQNCKTCGNVCALSHAQSACSQETCVVTTCQSGWANCDKNDANGCEINISQGDKGNCGACGKKCVETNGGATCTGGTCVIQCFVTGPTAFGDCNNNPDDGCEVDLKTNPLNCGVCGKACNPLNVDAALCKAGGCDYANCKPGFTDCDGNRANGCEINTAQDKSNCGTCGKVCQAPSGGNVVCSAGTCQQNCGSGLTNCSGVCVNTTNDINNCGNCASKCTPPPNSTATCSGGGCGFVCNNGWATCGTAQCYQNGSDVTHCCSGAGCNTACTACSGPTSGSGNPTCGAGSCGVQCTAPTSGKCGTNCYNFQADVNHCGGCTTVCTAPTNGTNPCTNGACVPACNTGYHLCGAACKSNSDVGSCGTSCSPCPGPSVGTGTATCDGTSCGINCGGGTPDKCGSTCVDKQSSEAHCGTCGNACGAGEMCCGGSCKAVATDEGFCGNCTTSCSQPTETCCGGACKDTDADEQHCQTCGTACGAGKFCCNGGCNGVQNDSSPNANNCGPTCTNCSGGKTCVNGACT